MPDGGFVASLAPDGRPWPMDLRRVLALLPCGRTWLLEHLRAWPMFRGSPTHRHAREFQAQARQAAEGGGGE